MAPQSSSRSSKTSSIVSVDPVVASQITGAIKSTGQVGHARTESTPTRAVSTPLSTGVKGHGRTNSAPNRNLKKRSNSLRRAKNSTELLKQRSIAAEKSPRQAESSNVKRGRNFTVSNVGTGGLLHLSPSPHQALFPPPPTTPSPLPWLAPTAQVTLPTTTDNVLYSQHSHARTRSVSPKRLLGLATQKKTSGESFRAHNHNRSQSFSTLDESRKSVSAALQPKTLKIVINRPESAQTSEDEDLEEVVPTLQIPIPHYKLGTPRFSAHGTPFLRGSYTHGSGVTSTNHSSMAEGTGARPPTSVQELVRDENSTPSTDGFVPIPGPLRVLKSGQRISDMSPISPELYDRLLAVYDDPSVVRYTSNKRDIVAATKIRIIAQISSESFMDYDLVSDFFLTFRSYMTTFEVLDYLLARLKWSVARLSDDGRIIRIRTFAALRHWILNYFTEDFVVNRHLRVRFCDEVNALYDNVRQRPRGMGGVSDLKILQDLKRCWNGRCALYWDADGFNMDANQEDSLLPGGVIGSRNPGFADITEATAALGLDLQSMPQSSHSPLQSTTSRASRRTQHKRLPSSDYAKKPVSIGSESSLQATSCALPRCQSRSPEKNPAEPGRAPQPVSVLSRRQNAPSDLKVQVHARADSQSNKVEEPQVQTPVEALVNSGQYVDPHAGSMIRGFVYGPVEPFIQLPLNPPLSPSVRFSTEQLSPSSPRTPQSPQTPTGGPAMKNIFGSLRRALSGKQGSNEVTLITTVPTTRPATAQTGRRAAVPVHLAHSNDDLRKKAARVPAKTELRIDLLCAAAVQSFQAVVPGAQAASTSANTQQTPTQHAPFSPLLSSPAETRQQHPSFRLPSHCTARSGSILIVDDTAVAMPVMSGALLGSYVHVDQQPGSASPSTGSAHHQQHTSFETQIALPDEMADDREIAQDGEATNIIQPVGLTVQCDNPETNSRTASAVTVKKLEPSPVLEERKPDIEGPADSLRSTSPPSMTEATSKSESPVSKPPAHGLRRRPGGDLRKNENVHDLETSNHHESMDSMLHSSSYGGSLILTGKSPPAKSSPAQHKNPQQVSMINTNSSHHLRPSFQAAISEFSSIPDEDDGGLEATLLKLEGRYIGRLPNPSNNSMSPTNRPLTRPSEKAHVASTSLPENKGISITRYKHGGRNIGSKPGSDFPSNTRTSSSRPVSHDLERLENQSPVSVPPTGSHTESDSEGSEISLPILSHGGMIGQALTTATLRNNNVGSEGTNEDARSSSDILERKSTDITKTGTTDTDGATSFLLDEDETMSDLSSEISVDVVNYSEAMGKSISPMLAAPGTAVSGLEIPSHPLTHASIVNLSFHTSPDLAGAPKFVNQPPTPQQSPLLLQVPDAEASGLDQQQCMSNGSILPLTGPLANGPSHVPFILACTGEVLAQQFTIVEQSALTEIEWTDLVEMRWSNTETDALDWAEYMARNDDARGIEVVVSRFNLVTKWALSEIVLTQDIHERARVISKLIHVAAHSRRLHNFATMLQIMIALMSLCCTRLKKTWAIVSGPDRSLYKQMERLASPVRNFYNLREEMENEDLSSGCIPFVGLYVHDLNWNAQKPLEIPSGNGAEPLINFDRVRTAAVIIKSLLRLIDASLRYDLEPVHGIIERCLWLSALTNERIDTLSQTLEA